MSSSTSHRAFRWTPEAMQAIREQVSRSMTANNDISFACFSMTNTIVCVCQQMKLQRSHRGLQGLHGDVLFLESPQSVPPVLMDGDKMPYNVF